MYGFKTSEQVLSCSSGVGVLIFPRASMQLQISRFWPLTLIRDSGQLQL
jgi:hypothetical protein